MPEKKSINDKERPKVSNVQEQSFWSSLENCVSDILSPAELTQFSNELKKVAKFVFSRCKQ